MFRRAGRHAAAVNLFRKALVDGMEEEAKCHFNLAASLHECRTAADSNDDEALTHYLRAATLDSSGAAGIAPDAKANAAALHLLRGDPASALALCEEVLSVGALDSKQRFQPVAWCNLNTALRQLGRHDEAVARSWDALQELTNNALVRPSYFRNTKSDINSVSQSSDPSSNCGDVEALNGIDNKDSIVNLNVVKCCVKWGTKYCSDDVNRLAAGLQRHLLQQNTSELSSGNVDSNSTTHRRVVCFTDDPSGLDLTLVEAAPLPCPKSSDKAKSDANDSSISMPEGGFPKGLMGWWYKAYLFSEDAAAILGSGSRVVYIDLDTVTWRMLEKLISWCKSRAFRTRFHLFLNHFSSSCNFLNSPYDVHLISLSYLRSLYLTDVRGRSFWQRSGDSGISCTTACVLRKFRYAWHGRDGLRTAKPRFELIGDGVVCRRMECTMALAGESLQCRRYTHL